MHNGTKQRMIVGDRRVFAIESTITDVVESPIHLALGSFVIHVGGRSFGVQQPDATMLGCSFHEVRNRLERRGTHLLPLLTKVAAADAIEAYLDAIYRGNPRTDCFGISQQQFTDALQSSGSVWAPDGDEAFDDGSHILQFDVGKRVRIIAFVNTEPPDELSGTIREEWMESDLFYEIISAWITLFAKERSIKLNTKASSFT